MELYDIAIVGMGPGGIGAGVYAVRGGWKTIAFNDGPPGGQMLNTEDIDNYPGFSKIKGPELAEKMTEHLEALGLIPAIETVKSIDVDGEYKVVSTEDNKYKAKVVIYASGGYPRKLDVPGEKEFSGRGVTYCAVCDGPFFRNKDVVVVGGGDAAVEEALYLSNIVSSVKIIHRRDELRAARSYQEKAFEKENIGFVWDSIVKSIEGETKVDKVVVKNVKSGEESEIKTDGVFIYVGFIPNSGIISGLAELTDDGHIVVDSNLETATKGVYAIGDVREKAKRQIGTSISDGITAVLNSEKYLQ